MPTDDEATPNYDLLMKQLDAVKYLLFAGATLVHVEWGRTPQPDDDSTDIVEQYSLTCTVESTPEQRATAREFSKLIGPPRSINP